ncbi:olfactory receptor 52H1-like [Sorex fumeus]|uniref:olfactory receptor 52H1-like n=1 Tax=Sorex fumeus TaxID=62283 RepID=UPI0024AD1038|nr:olfactory receptor 52H1-like [Sorex fumeus]
MTILMMTTLNLTNFNSDSFSLVGIPGLEKFHIWIGIPFFALYLIALAGNGLLIYLIIVDHSLHAPLFFFLSILASTDLILSSTCIPKTLAIFWLKSHEITFSGCLTQLFFLHFSFFLDSGILFGMAFDRYMAICSPLRYTTILTPRLIVKIVVGIVGRSFIVIFPIVFLVKRLPFCRSRSILHTYCEHMGVARLACGDISINIWYSFSMPLFTLFSDLTFIGISYTFILRAVFHISSRDAREKALSTCGSHVSVMLMFYTPAVLSALIHRFGHNISRPFHIMFANLYVAIPPALNPIIYGVKTKQIRDRVILLFFPKRVQ